MTWEQIEKEFQRQVRLCSGIGVERMLEIVHEHWQSDRALWMNRVEKERYFKSLEETN